MKLIRATSALRKNIKKIVLGHPYFLRVFRLYIQPSIRNRTRTENLVDMMNLRSDVFVDIGANYGLYSIMMRKRANKILAFEPIPENVTQLKRLGITNLCIHPYCLGQYTHKTALRIPSKDGSLLTGLATAQPTNILDTEDTTDIHEISVDVKRFDDIWHIVRCGKLDFVKIDVEGYEFEVLTGMVVALKAEYPLLLVEIEYRHNPLNFEGAFELLGEIGYKPFFAKNRNSLTPLTDARPQSVQSEHESSPNYYNNFFFMTEDHIKRFQHLIDR